MFKTIATDFEDGTVRIVKKLLTADFSLQLFNSVCNDVINKNNKEKVIKYIVSQTFFDTKSSGVLIKTLKVSEVSKKNYHLQKVLVIYR